MPTINQFLAIAYDCEYESAYDLPQKRLFSNPKIYTASGKLDKRWYVYFSYREPNSGKLKRLTPFYGNANKYKTKEERMEVLTVYRRVLLKLLKQGYNPFVDNNALYQKLQSKNKPEQETDNKPVKQDKPVITAPTPEEEPKITLRDAFDYSLTLKEKLINERTKKDYKSKINVFLKWMDLNHPLLKYIDAISKKTCLDFLNHILSETSPRNRNNYRADLSSIMQVLEDNEVIEVNFIKKIPVLKSKPERHKRYTQDMQEAIFEHLEDKDPTLLLYIKFISYSFLRPKEVCRLKIKDLNIKDETMQFKAKNSPLKTKIIPKKLMDNLPDLTQMHGEDYLFTPEKIGGAWDTQEDNKRDYFTKRFKKIIKEPFKLGTDYSLYSFRHTYITKVYRALLKNSSPFAAKSELMRISGHTSMIALEKYLRDIDAELPTDYSDML